MELRGLGAGEWTGREDRREAFCWKSEIQLKGSQRIGFFQKASECYNKKRGESM